MIISHSHRFVFFSNPKTGSESVRALLDPYNEEEIRPLAEHLDERQFYPHMRPVEVEAAFAERGWDFHSYYRFVFTRNPWARLVSLFEMVHGQSGAAFAWKRRARHAARRLAGGSGDPYFHEWLAGTRPDGEGGGGRPVDRWRRYGTYSLLAYTAGHAGEELVDRVVCLERVETDLPAVLNALGLPPGLSRRLPRINRRSHRHYATYYHPASRDLVAQRYAADIARFGYRFESSAGAAPHD